MLQPDQLKRVAASRPNDVAAFRAFFVSAGVLPGSAAALHRVVERLEADSDFRRDLSLHVWTTLYSEPRPGAAELLGIVALAAAGQHFAPAILEEDARELLQFLLNTGSLKGEAPAAMQQPLAARSDSPAPSNAWLLLHQSARWVRHRHVWIAGTFAAMLALALFTVQLRKGRSAAPYPTVRTAFPHDELSSPSDSVVSKLSLPAAQPHHGTIAFVSPQGKSHARDSAANTMRSRLPASATLAASAAPAVVPASPPDANTPAPLAPAVERFVPATRSNSAVATDILSRQLGTRSLPTDAPGYEPATGHSYPRLLRRHPLLPLAGPDDPLVAGNVHPALPGTGATAAFAAVVRPVSLGTMAANVLYSPAPAYPPQAAAARVQGIVKVQAEVDRNGNVASARVISGPPMLRDAAVDAVQRWRYRPFLVGGRPVSASATAMVEFELQ